MSCDSLAFDRVHHSLGVQKNGCGERFIRTLKEQLLWLTRFAGIEELHAALQEFVDPCNNLWFLGRFGYKRPTQCRRRFLVDAA